MSEPNCALKENGEAQQTGHLKKGMENETDK